MKIHTLFTLLWTITQVNAESSTDFKPICSDCWCTTHGATDCPAVGTDYHYHIPEEWDVLETFTNVGDDIVLQAPGGGECSPFKDLLGSELESFEEGQLPQCEISPPQAGNYCGYKYSSEDNTQSCKNREYTMVSYDTEEALKTDGAHLMHAGRKFVNLV